MQQLANLLCPGGEVNPGDRLLFSEFAVRLDSTKDERKKPV